MLAALAVAVGEFWPQLETWARTSLLAAATVALHVTGWAVRGHPAPAIERITAFLWLLATVCLAGAVVVALGDGEALSDETVILVAAIVALIDATVLAVARPGTLQQLAVFAAVVAVALSALAHVDRIEPRAMALVVWALGVTWLLGAWSGLLRPLRTGYALGAVSALVAAMVVAGGDWSIWGLALGLVTSAALIAASVPAVSAVLLGSGTAGAFVFVTWTAADRFAETIGVPLTLFVVGAALVAIALGTVRLRARYLEQVDG